MKIPIRSLLGALALASMVTFGGCGKQPEIVPKTEAVAPAIAAYRPPAPVPVAPVKVSETFVANCVADTRKLPANRHLPKSLKGFRHLASSTKITLAPCAGGVTVSIDRVVKKDTVIHETLWGEVRTTLNEQATALAQVRANAAVKAAYDARYQAALKHTPATVSKSAAVNQAVTTAPKPKTVERVAPKHATYGKAVTHKYHGISLPSKRTLWIIAGVIALIICGFVAIRNLSAPQSEKQPEDLLSRMYKSSRRARVPREALSIKDIPETDPSPAPQSPLVERT